MRVTMFTTPWCGYCVWLKRQLERAGIAYDEVDIEQNPDAEHVVARVNGGSRTVPTVLFPDGTAATNPSLAEIEDRMRALA
ncbi:MAG TPA: mycoredoxin [Mycobacteriales bacterium]|nr:mycoredoxin [Mycobacteriales bacterium]